MLAGAGELLIASESSQSARICSFQDAEWRPSVSKGTGCAESAIPEVIYQYCIEARKVEACKREAPIGVLYPRS